MRPARQVALALFLAAGFVHGQEIHPDGRITFRFRDPNAKRVFLEMDGFDPQPMSRDGAGIWTMTTAPLAPDFYSYHFRADGVALLDPSNPAIVPNLLHPDSEVHVPGPASLAWETGNVPHGVVHHHFYESKIAGGVRDFFVYTPPGYNPSAAKPYPVLYLLHGFSHGTNAWTMIGRANVILDNLRAWHKIKPMVVVMPYGYSVPRVLDRGGAVDNEPGPHRLNIEKFRDVLLTETIPQAEKLYRISSDRRFRALAGLSMGGGEALYAGLTSLDHFAWIGSFSAGSLDPDFASDFPSLNTGANGQLRLLWISCGTGDGLFPFNRSLRSWLKAKQIHMTEIETPGRHTWMVWRRNLVNFLPLLFR